MYRNFSTTFSHPFILVAHFEVQLQFILTHLIDFQQSSSIQLYTIASTNSQIDLSIQHEAIYILEILFQINSILRVQSRLLCRKFTLDYNLIELFLPINLSNFTSSFAIVLKTRAHMVIYRMLDKYSIYRIFGRNARQCSSVVFLPLEKVV